MNLPKISQRLQCAGNYVRAGAFLADVGTDHAYLPIALLLAGKIRGGVVSDIHKGPIERATSHIREWSLTDKLTPILCDGLSELESYHPEDVCILGMGGELISEILSRAPWLKHSGLRLILQPMTHPEAVRRYLLSEGYEIVGESLVKEEKLYQILCAEYTGTCSAYSPLEELIGRGNLDRADALTHELVAHWEHIFSERREAKRGAGADAREEEEFLKEIGEWKHDRI